MTCIANSSSLVSDTPRRNRLADYWVEVVTFDGDSELVLVQAHNAEEAQTEAAALIDNADYTMVHTYY